MVFPETRAAWRRLTIAWGELRKARVAQRTIRKESAMTPQQIKHFDAAFAHMDKAFDEMHKAFNASDRHD